MLALLAGSAACSSTQPAPPPPSSPSSSPAPAAPPVSEAASTTAPQVSKYPKAQLATQPCLALDARDLVALGVTGQGRVEGAAKGPTCHWKVAGQNVNLDLDVPLSDAKVFTKNGRVSQVPVGTHQAVQAEFQRICFIFVAVGEADHLVGTTTIPDREAPQEGICPAGAAVAAAALTHIE
ncbi:hypothetical protein HUW46_07928 [Amycolatopsis sp. CA-230715]|nr:hypothetical protein HUW46_07928 [Amycolatopsis sp. CA-230715]